MRDLGDFRPEDVERARRYHRPLHRAAALGLALGLAVPVALAFTPLGAWLFRPVAGLPWPAGAAGYAALVALASDLVGLPLAFWRGHLHERAWGFSTQTVRGWAADRAKGAAIGLLLVAAAWTGLVALARALPSAWPLVAAPAAASLAVLASFVAPVVLEPVFNRFAPLADQALAADLRALADRAGVPVREVLVADATRRTRKSNAYVSGLGATRRVVLFDTLLGQAEPREIRVVVAHELAHRRDRHIARSTALAAVGAAALVVVLWAAVRWPALAAATGAGGAGDPRSLPLALVVASALELASAPLGAALSRRWETAADRAGLELTGDLEGFVAAFRRLATANLIDLEPPRWLRALFLTHPTPPERIANARRWAAAAGAAGPAGGAGISPAPGPPTRA